ncbi:DUF4158 domain-containing protein [Streptomyces griseoluteus]|uniref:DUF4158 domain-containing protein n=1 Tax=Streptomyces griseoluteus TaxID=29306 RepID=A0A4Z1CYV4_STRGP|nr:DUF4158 domain-containing protein [Streptomyces griseoluteus]
MSRFPKPDEYPETVVDFVRRAVEPSEETVPWWATGRPAERQRTEVRRRMGATYDQAEARRIAEGSIRKEAAAKNRPADLINIALEKVVGAGLELSAFSTLDAMTSTVRKEVNASICTGMHDRNTARTGRPLSGLVSGLSRSCPGPYGKRPRRAGTSVVHVPRGRSPCPHGECGGVRGCLTTAQGAFRADVPTARRTGCRARRSAGPQHARGRPQREDHTASRTSGRVRANLRRRGAGAGMAGGPGKGRQRCGEPGPRRGRRPRRRRGRGRCGTSRSAHRADAGPTPAAGAAGGARCAIRRARHHLGPRLLRCAGRFQGKAGPDRPAAGSRADPPGPGARPVSDRRACRGVRTTGGRAASVRGRRTSADRARARGGRHVPRAVVPPRPRHGLPELGERRHRRRPAGALGRLREDEQVPHRADGLRPKRPVRSPVGRRRMRGHERIGDGRRGTGGDTALRRERQADLLHLARVAVLRVSARRAVERGALSHLLCLRAPLF